jgi:hypothetical protein
LDERSSEIGGIKISCVKRNSLVIRLAKHKLLYAGRALGIRSGSKAILILEGKMNGVKTLGIFLVPKWMTYEEELYHVWTNPNWKPCIHEA